MVDWRLLTEKNEGSIDRGARIVIGLALLVVFALGYVGGWLNWLVLLASLIALFTGMAGHCTAYSLLGINTKEKQKMAAPSKK